eukprot:5205_1
MSSFNFENVHEQTHSQFSFDESLISPNFISSPSLSNHYSNSIQSNSSNDDVIEALSSMQNGCFMIVLQLPIDDGVEEQSHSKQTIDIEWSFNTIDSSNQNIVVNSQCHDPNTIPITDIESVSKLHRDSASDVQQTLNIAGVEQIGLQAVTLRLTMKSDHSFNYFLIFDNYRTAFIWNRGLRTMIHMIGIQQPLTTIAICCSSVDRINNLEMHQKMKINDDVNALKWIQHIDSKLPHIQKHIHRCHDFAQASCILDSSQHLSLLIQTRSLTEMHVDAKKLSSVPFAQLAKHEIASLREVWLSLLADLSVAMLKEHQLRNDMMESRQTLAKLQISM